ncbi:hypothetical protein U9M48_000221 [Paspalum notatum var. saurae]|uniref:Uncharacterized protein n=1 Tax=Paspalum notatum var. saurae TaxID=547442 RepID=A0AAQ3PLY8_PASNO
MAGTPEDPDEPFSPSVFLDLPPTPHPDDDGGGESPASSSDNLPVLPFVRRMLMEEDADDSVLYQQYADDHPALLLQAAEQTFAHILSSSAATTSSSHAATATDSSVSAGGSATTTNAGVFSLSPASGDVDVSDATWWPYDDQDELLLSQRQAHADTGFHFHQSASPAGGNRVTMDMLNLAFLKGMQEANKFLPTTANNNLAVLPRDNREEEDDGMEAMAGRRSAKLMMAPQPEESGEVAEDVFLKAYEVALQKMQGLSVGSSVPPSGKEEEEKAKSEPQGRPRRRRRQSSSSGNEAAVDLRTLLTHCAEAVSTGNRVGATELLRRINQRASPTGDAWQRLAHCFAQGLELRLAGGTGVRVAAASAADLLRAHQMCMQVCCFQMATFSFSHMAICKAAAGRNKLHIVDYGEHHGFQWPPLLGQLAAREGGPPAVRITTVGVPQPGFRPAAQIDEIGRRLTAFARRCGLPSFRFRGVVAARWETVRAADVGVEPDEVLVVNGLNHFGRLMDEGGVDDGIEEGPCPRDMVLANIREMRPDVFVLCVENSSCGAPFFVTRFREALFYYSAMFDMMEATAPRDSAGRAVLEQHVLGPCALNAIACEGSERVERPETYKQWQVRCSRAGLRQLPLNPSAVKRLSEEVRNGYHEEFVIDVDQQWLLQGWKGRILYAISTWTAQR